jgi:hypothetical protein
MRDIIILCLLVILTSLVSCADGGYADSVTLSPLYFVILDDKDTLLITNYNFEFEKRELDKNNNFQKDNNYKGFVVNFGYNSTNYVYGAGIGTFFPKQNYNFYLRARKTYIKLK